MDCPAVDASAVQPGQVNTACGLAAYTYIGKAIEAAMAGGVAAVVTAPINKESLNLAGVKFPGHTEIFAAKTRADRACMMQTSDELTVTFVTTHVRHSDVPKLVTRERVLEVIELTADAVSRIRGKEPAIVVCGLNPHAGEHGLFGGEEEQSIVPAVEAAKARGLDVCGPVPPDTAFLPARRETTDAFVCMYHDQGHIPLKMLAFDKAVNVTLGLPVIRTSVDHGTAFDIAWQGRANPGSLIQAILLAVKLAGG
jgi:4-hydroxythreonine-4-phosphate dehydrogenase